MTIQESIEQKIIKSISIQGLEVINESQMHNVPPGSESHFKVIIISDDFSGQKLLRRHQWINQLLEAELAGGVHALSIQALTKNEWEEKGHTVLPSPKCLGGGVGSK